MILKRFYDEKLAQASYLVGCAATGEAVVVDPSRDIAQYVDAAEKEGLRIVAVTETHIHADYVSGSRELGKVTGATVYLSDEGDENWKYGYANEPNVKLVTHGDKIVIGNVSLEVAHTPGHTPEHISFILRDHPVSDSPMAVFTGDFIFVGDVGRPDLLERAANFQGTMVAGAKTLFQSLRKTSEWPAHLLIWPAHGAGSACGKSLGGVPVSTIGYERSTNWALSRDEESKFVDEVLEGQPEPPAYFRHMKRINKVGPEFIFGNPAPSKLDPSKIFDLANAHVNLVDIRPQSDSVRGFIPGSLLVGMAKAFPNWAGWLLDFEKPIYLIAESEPRVREAVKDLHSVGLDNVAGWFDLEVLIKWTESGRELSSIPQATATEALSECCDGSSTLLDVRGKVEHESGNISGSVHVPLGEISSRLEELDRDTPFCIHCQSGYRSNIACGILLNAGFEKVKNVVGAYPALVAEDKQAAKV